VQNLYAEHPELKNEVAALKGEKTEQTLETLATLWNLPKSVANIKADELVAIGFFQKRGSRNDPTFWVPFLYRDALEMVQGLADEEE